MAKIVVTQDNTVIYVSDGDIVEIDIAGGGTVTVKAAPGETVTRFKVHFKGDDQSDTLKVDLATFSQNDLQIDIQHYDPSDTVALLGAFNKGVDPDNDDEFSFSYVGTTGNTFNGFVNAKDGGERDFNQDPSPVVICFGEGTIIDTALGPRPVEGILTGDLVMTQDHGPQRVRWVGKRTLDSIDLMRHPQLCPIRVAKGALGAGLPFADLLLSPQHRLQVSDWRTEYLFAECNVLVAAKHLVNGKTITVEIDAATVTYHHLLFDAHEIVSANGAPAESLHPGDVAMDAIDTASRTEILQLFPELPGHIETTRTAHRVLRSFEAQAVASYACA